jgi:hypothetical protein
MKQSCGIFFWGGVTILGDCSLDESLSQVKENCGPIQTDDLDNLLKVVSTSVAGNGPTRSLLVSLFDTDFFHETGGDANSGGNDLAVVGGFERSSKALLNHEINLHFTFNLRKVQ